MMRCLRRGHRSASDLAADGAVLAVAGVYLGFPALLALRNLVSAKPLVEGEAGPHSVTVVVAAHNESADIGAKLDDIARQVVPSLDAAPQVIVASDGSTDDTVAIARAHRLQPTVLDLPRLGKAGAMNRATEQAGGDVVVFTDANSRLAPDVFDRLLAPFRDPAVGGVAGDQRYGDLPSGTAASERNYWSYERIIKRLESGTSSVVSATGTLHALRRELIDVIPPDVTDDFYLSVGAVVRGRRLVFEPRAQAWEMPNEAPGDEYRRRVRILTRGFTSVWRRRTLFDPLRHGWYSVDLFVHKVARRLVFVPLVVSAATSVALRRRGGWRRASFVAHAGLVAAAAVGIAFPTSRIGRLPFVALPAHFVLANAAAAHALINLARTRSYTTWAPVRSADTPMPSTSVYE